MAMRRTCNPEKPVRFWHGAPSELLKKRSPGRPLRSRRQSEKLDKHVRLVLLAPSVTVAEWLRRATVDRFTADTVCRGRSACGTAVSAIVRFSHPIRWEVVHS